MKSISPQELVQKATEKKEENDRFTAFIKTNRLNIDEKTWALSLKYETAIDCTLCGNCCSRLHPGVNEEDITKIASACHINNEEVIEKYLVKEPKKDIFYLKNSPCSFLHQCTCSIYENRPESCADYPHLRQPYLRFKLKGIMENYQVCPIVYHVIEELKEATGFQKDI